VTAGAALVRELPTWDWGGLTFRAVATRAEVSERTVYRHFPTERQLHDAVMARLEDEAGITYENVELATIAEVNARMLTAMHRFAAEDTNSPPVGAAVFGADERRRAAVERAVAAEAADLTDVQRRIAAGLLDAAWHPTTFERLVRAWQLDDETAGAAVEWLIATLVSAIRNGDIAGADPKPASLRRSSAP
jgi:AcrR family transcriptional regulator